MHGRFDRASPERGAVFLCTLLSTPPEQDETGTIRKHWNGTTKYAKTGLEQDAASEIHVLVRGEKTKRTTIIVLVMAYRAAVLYAMSV